ncbi:AAA family ATPase [Chryseobacterium sp. KACC 21268]|nr:AAA family ATPase [Chryseobacterium sp. KACC 21268]
MDIISKIEIKHFRSFDGGKDQEKVHIEELGDFNIFSGANDSGKSNVLRALNLFFNNEISPGVKFDRERDFSKIVSQRFDDDIQKRREQQKSDKEILETTDEIFKFKDLRRSDEVLTIKLTFNNKNKQRGLPEKFWISKIFSQYNNFAGAFNYPEALNKAQTTAFLNNFQFEYIPAIKDRNFFNYLFTRLQNYLFEKKDKLRKNKFRQSSDDFNKVLKSETGKLFENFFDSSGVQANFHIPNTLVDFFRTLSVQTENDVSLFERGDGVQARFIPEILDEISQGKNKNIIWGFEEPENSYEARNIRKIKEDFQYRYSKKYQIFITTHTKEFLATQRDYTQEEKDLLNNTKLAAVIRNDLMSKLSDSLTSSKVSIYRVWKNEKRTSLITRFDEKNNAWNDICDDLGVIQEARIIDELQEKILNQTEEIQKSSLTIDQQKSVYAQLEKDYKLCADNLQSAEEKIEEILKPILFVEDKYPEIYMIAYLKLNDIDFEENDLIEKFKENAYFAIRRACGAGSVAGFLAMNTTDGYEDKKIIGLFDHDKEGCENFYHLQKRTDWDNEILGDKKSGFYKKRKNHQHFFALLLPIPDRLENVTSNVINGKFQSFVEIENLISQQKLIDLDCVEEDQILDRPFYKIKDKIKSKAFQKFGGLPKEDFDDFNPLFDKIKILFDY